MKEMMMNSKNDCDNCRTYLPDLLLDDSYVLQHPELARHMSACKECEAELAALRETMELMESWTAPEPSIYFDAKLRARLREAQTAAPEKLLDRIRSYFLYNTMPGLRPVMAGVLAILLVIGGGGLLVSFYPHTLVQAQVSPTVNDLKIMDNNAQALQQMDQLLDSSRDDGSAPPTT